MDSFSNEIMWANASFLSRIYSVPKLNLTDELGRSVAQRPKEPWKYFPIFFFQISPENINFKCECN